MYIAKLGHKALNLTLEAAKAVRLLAAMWLAFAAALVSGFSSCSSSADEFGIDGEGDDYAGICELGLYIKLGETSGDISRATPAGDYDPG
ncbi:MAG: hypothetical protein K2M76_01145, partial [Muribaculaceae bacterium]|nr:hypothetical protein [Muribaculaceae bacterium]